MNAEHSKTQHEFPGAVASIKHSTCETVTAEGNLSGPAHFYVND